MIKLTDRLQIIANQIEQSETMADVGTDHGFLPIYLWERCLSPEVIMTDISSGSLEKARRECCRLYPDISFDFRLGDGITVLEEGEVDVIVLAGMGGVLMTEILADDLKKTRSFKKIILQPRTGQGVLRRWLIEHNFIISRESLVREGKYICEILTIGGESEISSRLSRNIEYEVPPWLKSAGELANPFIRYKIQVYENIQRGQLKSNANHQETLKEINENITYLTNLLGGISYVDEF